MAAVGMAPQRFIRKALQTYLTFLCHKSVERVVCGRISGMKCVAQSALEKDQQKCRRGKYGTEYMAEQDGQAKPDLPRRHIVPYVMRRKGRFENTSPPLCAPFLSISLHRTLSSVTKIIIWLVLKV